MKSSRVIHFVSLAATLVVLIYTMVAVPELWSGKAVTFATFGGFFTAYGVAFAVIESWRARSASELARRAASEANQKLASLYNVKNIAECQACIRNVLLDLEKDGWASTAGLSRIIELYTAEFHQAYSDPLSEQRGSIASLQSHAASASGPLTGRALKRLKDTLVKMLADVTAAAGNKISENQR